MVVMVGNGMRREYGCDNLLKCVWLWKNVKEDALDTLGTQPSGCHTVEPGYKGHSLGPIQWILYS